MDIYKQKSELSGQVLSRDNKVLHNEITYPQAFLSNFILFKGYDYGLCVKCICFFLVIFIVKFLNNRKYGYSHPHN